VAEHPEYVVEKNAMNFLSDNGGNNYNLCHCTFFFKNQTKGVGSADHVHYQHKKFGATLRLPIWTFGAAKPTRRSLNISIVSVVFITR
jgi:hypothetical protein